MSLDKKSFPSLTLSHSHDDYHNRFPTLSSLFRRSIGRLVGWLLLLDRGYEAGWLYCNNNFSRPARSIYHHDMIWWYHPSNRGTKRWSGGSLLSKHKSLTFSLEKKLISKINTVYYGGIFQWWGQIDFDGKLLVRLVITFSPGGRCTLKILRGSYRKLTSTRSLKAKIVCVSGSSCEGDSFFDSSLS